MPCIVPIVGNTKTLMPPARCANVFGFLPDFVDYCTNTTFSCNVTEPPCKSPLGLSFPSLWTITANYFDLCGPDGAWLSSSTVNIASAALAAKAAYAIAGAGETKFPKADVYSRLTTWKFPLIQLIATLPRPPLGWLTEVLTVVHLVSDPIGSITDLLHKLESYQRQAVFWQNEIQLRDSPLRPTLSKEEKEQRDRWRDRWRRGLALITESYSELGQDLGDQARRELQLHFRPSGPHSGAREQKREDFLSQCSTTAGALAADRATSFLPVAVAEIIFIAVFFIDIIRLQSNEQTRLSSTTFVNIEMHSIGFSALFFWLIPAVLIAAIIGTSQTEKAIPRILVRFQRDLKHAKIEIDLPELKTGAGENCDPKQRWLYGMYSWQSQPKAHTSRQNQDLELACLRDSEKRSPRLRLALIHAWPFIHTILPYAVFACAILTGILISLLVPPWGWRCRTWGETYFAFAWISSFLLSNLISWPRVSLPPNAQFYLMLCKDTMVTGLVIAWIIITQLGYYNRPECYMKGDETGLVLPEQPDAYAQLQRGLRFGGSYLTILVSGILIQAILIPGLLYVRYEYAFWTLVQKDNSSSEMSSLEREAYASPLPSLTSGDHASPIAPAPAPLGGGAGGDGQAMGEQNQPLRDPESGADTIGTELQQWLSWDRRSDPHQPLIRRPDEGQ